MTISRCLGGRARVRIVLPVAILATAACSQNLPLRPDAVEVSASSGSMAVRLGNADNGGRPLTTTLIGAEEVPGPGDPDGTGTAVITLNHGQSQICFELTAADIDPATAAHIHEGLPGVAGPVVVPLAAPTGGTSSGCVTVERELVKEIIQDPGEYYVNVHNAAFEAGAIRGQLAK